MTQATRSELEFASSTEPEATFRLQLDRLIRRTSPRGRAARDWARQPFRPLLLGYNGKGNVGADLRVRELVRQMKVIFGHVPFDPQLVRMDAVMLDPELAALPAVAFEGYFPDFIEQWLPRVDGIVACEGTMFTSKFSDILGATFAGALGLAARRGELAVAYGAESGRMSPGLEQFVRRTGEEGGLVLSRSRQTHDHLRSLGLNSRLGADTAWTYDPPPSSMAAARQALAVAGWDGRAPVAVVCPMDPFCWPLRVDVERAREVHDQGLHDDDQYAGVMFHGGPDDRDRRLACYLDGLRYLLADLRSQGFFTVMVGMEKLDGRTCARLNALLPMALPTFVSGTVAAGDIVAVLHHASMVVTSRFHAAVLSINAGVRTIGIALDERIRNLFNEAGLDAWFVSCDAEQLGQALVERANRLRGAEIEGCYRTLLVDQLERIGRMGIRLADEVARVYGDFPAVPLPRDWRAHLPPLSERLRALID